ncbi:MAG: CHAD domain-containing protein [Acidimicrobiales bacterium]
MQQLERELKLAVDMGWSLPDLSQVLPGTQASALATVALTTTYYDTSDLRLARRHVTLRYRVQDALAGAAPARPPRPTGATGPAGQWTLKLPSTLDGALLARTEVTWAAEPSTRTEQRNRARQPKAGGALPGRRRPAPPPVHPDAAKFVSGLSLGFPLRAVARLQALRRRVELRAPDGHLLAEVDHDVVTGRRLLGARGTVAFSEVEVELAPRCNDEVLDAVLARLTAAGASPSSSKSKLLQVLGAGPTNPGGPGHMPERSVPGLTVSEVLRAALLDCQDVLLAHDPAIRLDDPDPEHVHKARVATRRLRSTLKGLRTSFWDDQLAQLYEEAGWLGSLLGGARDADIRVELLRTELASLGPLDAAGAGALLQLAGAGQRLARQRLVLALGSDRYIAFLRALEGYKQEQREANAPVMADEVLPALVKRNWRSLNRQVDKLGSSPSDDALHKVRIKAKRLRYAAELVAGQPRLAGAKKRPAPDGSQLASGHVASAKSRTARLPKRATIRRVAEAASGVQDVLGHLHDAVLAEAWLREAALAATPSTSTELALVAGQLLAATRAREAEHRAAWPRSWSRLKRAASSL